MILGEEEEDQNKVKIKDLKSSGEISVDQAQLIHQLEKLDQEGGIRLRPDYFRKKLKLWPLKFRTIFKASLLDAHSVVEEWLGAE